MACTYDFCLLYNHCVEGFRCNINKELWNAYRTASFIDIQKIHYLYEHVNMLLRELRSIFRLAVVRLVVLTFCKLYELLRFPHASQTEFLFDITNSVSLVD